MQKTDAIKPGSVVQVNPEIHSSFFKACFMLVTEVSDWGLVGFVAIPGKRGEPPGRAYYRANWEEVEYVGQAQWMPVHDEDKS